MFDGTNYLVDAGRVQVFDWEARPGAAGEPILGTAQGDNFGQHSLLRWKDDCNNAPYASQSGVIYSGRASVYGIVSDQWTKISSDIGGEAANNYLYYVSLARDGSKLVTGARYNSDGGYVAGHSRVFEVAVDSDSDGFADATDMFPDDALEWLDSDSDGIGDNSDSDNDNDGVPNVLDGLPFDPSEVLDTDKDGIGNNADDDDDGDGVSDDADAFPLDRTESKDTDNDGIGNNKDPDDDGDGVLDAASLSGFHRIRGCGLRWYR